MNPFRQLGPFRQRGPFRSGGPFVGKGPFGTHAPFWDRNLFWSQAEYDAYRADSRVLAADKARAVLATQSALQSLGFSNAASTSNPPPTVTGKDGTLQYAPHNIVKASANFGDASWNQNGTASTAGAGATVAGWGTSRFTGNANTAGYYCTFAYQPANGEAFVIAHYVSRVSGAGVFVGGTDAFGTQLKFDPVGGTFSGGPSNKGAVAVAGGWLIWGQYAGNGSPMGAICYGNGTFDVATWAMRGSALLDYVPTTSAAAYGLPITYDRGATENRFLNSATAVTQTITVVSGQVYTISGLGTGSIALSSGGSGTLSPGSTTLRGSLTFTASGTSVVCTVTGSVTKVNFNVGYATVYLETGASILYTDGTPRSQNLIGNSVVPVAGAGSNTTDTTDGGTGFRKITSPGAGSYNFEPAISTVGGCVYVAQFSLYATGTSTSATIYANGTSGGLLTSAIVSGPGAITGGTSTNPRITGLSTSVPTVVLVTWLGQNVLSIYPTATGGGSSSGGEALLVTAMQANEGSVLLSYVATTGTPYSEYPQFGEQRFGAATRETLHPRDLTQAAWTKSGSMTAAKTATDEGGVANACSTLTSAGTNQTCLQSVTSASANRAFGPKIRSRSASSLTIDLTCDGGTTWQAVTVNAAWLKWPITQATVTNPSYGFRLRGNGDSIDVDVAQGELVSLIGANGAGIHEATVMLYDSFLAWRLARRKDALPSPRLILLRQLETRVLAPSTRNQIQLAIKSFYRFYNGTDNFAVDTAEVAKAYDGHRIYKPFLEHISQRRTTRHKDRYLSGDLGRVQQQVLKKRLTPSEVLRLIEAFLKADILDEAREAEHREYVRRVMDEASTPLDIHTDDEDEPLTTIHDTAPIIDLLRHELGATVIGEFTTA